MIASTAIALTLLAAADAAAKPEAERAWSEAWAGKPSLVSLGSMGELGGDPEAVRRILRDRLKLLGKKTFSNREWKAYWQRQMRTASEFAAFAAAAGDQGRAAGLKDWADLAKAKIANQDVYLTAIETERDAVEERLEVALGQGGESKRPAPPQVISNPTPFQQRLSRIHDLQKRVEGQKARAGEAEVRLRMIGQQATSTRQLLQALEADLNLARRENQIAAGQAASSDPEWAALWAPIAASVADKATKIAREVGLGGDRQRGLKVEETLAQSQIAYRSAKYAELSADLDRAGSASGLWEAVVATASRWLTESLWKVLLALIGIWVLLRLGLVLIARMAVTIVKAADDQDDELTSQLEQRAETIAAVFSGIAKAGAYAVAGLTALEVIGINTGPIVGSVAILGLAISFGSQNLVKDVVNGFFILIENQYAVGDVVEICGRTGIVERINLRSTRLRQLDGTLHVIPNGQINAVANQTRDWCRAIVHVGVGYGSDLDQVERVVNQVGEALAADPEWTDKLDETPVFIGVTELADSSVNVRCMAKGKAGAQWSLNRELNRRLKIAFDAEGIEIPFPQRVMHQG